MGTGTVRTLLPGKKTGFLVSRAEGATYQFDEAAVIDGGSYALEIGQEVSFDAIPDPCESGHARAINIRRTGVIVRT